MGSFAKLLVVDDDPAIRAILKKRLEIDGYSIIEAGDAVEAQAAIERNEIGLVILDVMMPGMDGFELLRELRQRFTASALPIIILTALESKKDVIEAMRRGANDFLNKPIDAKLLLHRVRIHWASKEATSRNYAGYYIIEPLGGGGMASVFRSVEIETGKEVALKILPPRLAVEETNILRFLREARLARAVRHPNLVEVYGHGKHGGEYFIIMELVKGRGLNTLLREGPLSVRRSLEIARGLGAGLAVLAEAHILHRDIKPSNIIIEVDGTPRLIDFGIAREDSTGGRMTTAGQWIATPIYAAPEQLRGEGDFHADMYGLGSVLYMMLTGLPPFPADTPIRELLELKESKAPRADQACSDVPAEVGRVVARMLAPRVSRRYVVWEECLAALERVELAE